MITGIRPKVNEAREFLEIAKDFKDPKEIIREALSNSWDAAASKVTLRFDLVRIPETNKRKLMVTIEDDGEGMSSKVRDGINTSELEDFFNLGDSHKPYGSIGTKGHGTKIYYKSQGITVNTWKDGKHIYAKTEVPPWEALKNGHVPTYCYDESEIAGKGTKIIIDGFEGKQSEFSSIDRLSEYILWFTVLGSFGQYFGSPKRMDLELKTTNQYSSISIPFGFKFPEENTDLTKGVENYCKIIGPKNIDCGLTATGANITVDIIGAIMGESFRGEIVPHTYEMMGLWLCKDYIRVERNNQILEKIFKGQYYYRQFLIFANCQQFDLTANRNNIRSDQDEYELAIEAIMKFIGEIKDNTETKAYFDEKAKEDELKAKKKKDEEELKKKELIKNTIRDRLNAYRGRADLNAPGINGAPIKEPKSEAETALLLQAMISSNHPGIDFRIGEYKTYQGTDLLIEYEHKGIPTSAWAELVFSLEKLFAWPHPHEGIHKVICWELGNVKECQNFKDGKTAKLKKKHAGRYNLDIETDTIDVYVLREIIQA